MIEDKDIRDCLEQVIKDSSWAAYRKYLSGDIPADHVCGVGHVLPLKSGKLSLIIRAKLVRGVDLRMLDDDALRAYVKGTAEKIVGAVYARYTAGCLSEEYERIAEVSIPIATGLIKIRFHASYVPRKKEG
jgi:hypothetical protein